MAPGVTSPAIDLSRTGIWLLLGAAVLLAAAGLPEFREAGNLANVVRQSSALGLLAIGQTFVILAGLIDLSVGMAAGLVVVLACALMGGDAAATLPVALAMLALGAGIGAVNGTLANTLRVHPLILTFGMLFVLQGAIFTYTDRSVGRASEPLQTLANGDIAGIPISGLVLVAAAVAAHLVITRTRFGHHLVAVGGHAESARRSGIPVARIRFLAFVISGVFAAAGGLVLAGRLGTGYPLAGSGLELDAIVAVVLGGTALSGGRGSVVRSVAGVLVLAVASNVLNLLEVSAFVQIFVKGVIVIAAILANQPRRAGG
ncbi:MAG: ABC transporter permease [Alphaproteobacteria bacterium]|nr:ABC transporter permease [Alphaproteobacteria bacterium]MDX5368145.1 ABC transporter permease [Alphaproteobacteria bacterium]MDX5462976.1 ABC transporter permease [Alphaproteobacteria bacterium]